MRKRFEYNFENISNYKISNYIITMNEIKYIIGYIIYVIHIILCLIWNLSWIFISNIIYLYILFVSQVCVVLSWKIFDGQCVISKLENLLLNVKDQSITVSFLNKFLSKEISEKFVDYVLLVAVICTVIKIMYVKMYNKSN